MDASQSTQEKTAPPYTALPQYYENLNDDVINQSFRNFDDSRNIEYFNTAVMSSKSRNFCIDFGDDDAFCAFDLTASAVSRLIRSPRPATLNTRWVNIWLPSEQKDVLTVLARHYDFTPRLLSFMCSKPMMKPAKSTKSSSKPSSIRTIFSRHTNKKESVVESDQDPTGTQSGAGDSSAHGSFDVEDQFNMSELAYAHEVDISRTMNQYAMASDLWHFSTMDWGRRYICTGYNTLHVVEPSTANVDADNDPDDSSPEDLPACKRIWNWILLCEDKTVITIYEDPYPFRPAGPPLTHHEQKNLAIIRRNLVNVFRQCSKSRDRLVQVTPLALPLRIQLGDNLKETQHRPSDVPGLLFFYLFDDWLTIYTLIARRDNSFALELNDLRIKMLRKANLEQVNRLHHLGCQLAVLKRLYQGYSLLVDRLLGKREITYASLQNSQVMQSGGGGGGNGVYDSLLNTQPQQQQPFVNESQSMGVSFSSAAKVRFERLQHRLQLYALNEVLECLDQKESLVMMNFNLLAIKEALSVEKFTEMTLLVAKVTLLFLPVSLMTAYFSCQFIDYQFSYKTYWKWFAAVFVGSVLFVIVFTFISGTNEGRIVVKPLSRRVWDFSGKIVPQRRRRAARSGASVYAPSMFAR